MDLMSCSIKLHNCKLPKEYKAAYHHCKDNFFVGKKY